MIATRDETLSEEISACETEVERLADEIGKLVAHAEQHDAIGHAALYEAVQGSLTSAAKQLQRAHEVMLNGDADDYL